MEIWIVSEAPCDGGCEMRQLPDFNITAYGSGKGYSGTKSGRYAMSRRGPLLPTAWLDADLLWKMTNTSVDGTDIRATVADGVLIVSEYAGIDPSGTWSGMRVVKKVAVSGDEFTGIVDGDKLWLNVSLVLSASDKYRAQFQAIDDSIPTSYNTDSANGPDPHTHAITLKTGGANELAAQLLTSYKQYSSYTWLVDPDEQTDTDDELYIKIATFEVVDMGGGNSLLKIKPHIVGCPITIPLVSVTYGGSTGD